MNHPYYRVQINVDWNSLKSINAAEKDKATLKNAGYTLIDTQSNINTSLLIYAKEA